MKPSILLKLEQMVARHEEVAALLGEPEVIADQAQFRMLSKEYAPISSANRVAR